LKRHNAAASHAKHVVSNRQGINSSGFRLLLRWRRLRYPGRLWGLLLPHEGHDAHLLLELVLDRSLLRFGCALGKLVHHTISFNALEFSSGDVRGHRNNLPVHDSGQVL
jgi:hypothetical protein